MFIFLLQVKNQELLILCKYDNGGYQVGINENNNIWSIFIVCQSVKEDFKQDNFYVGKLIEYFLHYFLKKFTVYH